MGIEHPLGLEVVPCPHTLNRHTNTRTHLKNSMFNTIMALFVCLFQNPSEMSDEELNDDLLRSDDEDVDQR